MINILSIRCSLAFAPYLAASSAEFLNAGVVSSQVVRQGGRGLILRSYGDLLLRHEHRQASLGTQEARHYSAALQFRSEFYDIARMADEVVLANSGDELLLSHPQSEIWLQKAAVAELVHTFNSDSNTQRDLHLSAFPDWLKVSTGGERALLSDQRTGRWVLLADDHIRELERRLASLRDMRGPAVNPAPPTISIKGLSVHLQSALTLAATLDEFANAGRVKPFEEVTPGYLLKASASPHGLELSDSELRVALTAREARKWADIIRAELARLKVMQVERGGIRTVFADQSGGRWILQWGDELLLPDAMLSGLLTPNMTLNIGEGAPVWQRIGEFLLLLEPTTGACVALTDSETRYFGDQELVRRPDRDGVSVLD